MTTYMQLCRQCLLKHNPGWIPEEHENCSCKKCIIRVPSKLVQRWETESESDQGSYGTWRLYFYGASKGKLSSGAIGYILKDPHGIVAQKHVELLSDGKASLHEAEYEALISGMVEARRQGAKIIAATGPSEVVVQQVNAASHVQEELKLVHARVKELAKQFHIFSLTTGSSIQGKTEDLQAADLLAAEVVSRLTSPQPS